MMRWGNKKVNKTLQEQLRATGTNWLIEFSDISDLVYFKAWGDYRYQVGQRIGEVEYWKYIRIALPHIDKRVDMIDVMEETGDQMTILINAIEDYKKSIATFDEVVEQYEAAKRAYNSVINQFTGEQRQALGTARAI